MINTNQVIKEDSILNDEREEYNVVDNEKSIFKSLYPLSPTIYDASWNGLEEKISTQLLTDLRRIPNVMVVFKSNLKSIMDWLFNMEEI